MFSRKNVRVKLFHYRLTNEISLPVYRTNISTYRPTVTTGNGEPQEAYSLGGATGEEVVYIVY